MIQKDITFPDPLTLLIQDTEQRLADAKSKATMLNELGMTSSSSYHMGRIKELESILKDLNAIKMKGGERNST